MANRPVPPAIEPIPGRIGDDNGGTDAADDEMVRLWIKMSSIGLIFVKGEPYLPHFEAIMILI